MLRITRHQQKERAPVNKVAIMVDGASGISREHAESLGIAIMPYHIIVDGKDYLETEIDKKWLWSRLENKEHLPTTSFPSEGEFLHAYQGLARNSDDILYISLTSRFTKGYDAAIEAKRMALEKLPKTRIEIIDSCSVESGESLLAIAAARAAKEGKDLAEMVKLLNELIPKVTMIQATDTLFYRDKGGRIFQAKSWAKDELSNSFRAILEVDHSSEGITKPVARAKTKRQVMEKMVSFAREKVGNKKICAGITHTNIPEQAEQLKDMMSSQLQCAELYLNEASPISAVHNGKGLISLGFYPSD